MSQPVEVQEYSILRGSRLRPLHVAVAEQLARTEPDDPRWRTALRIYKALPVEQRTRCKAALVGIDG
jgi:hypothetical protein